MLDHLPRLVIEGPDEEVLAAGAISPRWKTECQAAIGRSAEGEAIKEEGAVQDT